MGLCDHRSDDRLREPSRAEAFPYPSVDRSQPPSIPIPLLLPSPKGASAVGASGIRQYLDPLARAQEAE